MSQKKPNIILINCDDLGYGDLGCYGSSHNRTPHLDRMAAEGMRFTSFYMASSVCSPSRGAMMTGCYPPRIGFGFFADHYRQGHVLYPGHSVGLNPEEITVAQVLKNANYATQIVGKWHCGDQPEFLPTRFGFDHYYGLPYSNDMGRQINGRADQPPLPLLRDEAVIEAQPDQSGLTERYVEESVRFIRDHADRPFFLYFAHMHVHLPHYPPERFMRTSRNGRYGAAVECIDWSVGVLMRELRDLGIEDNTLLLFTSDNGSNARFGGSNIPLRGTKATTWDGGFRVPLIARWPGVVPEGTVCDELATAMDFLPTFAALAGQAPPADRPIDGRDIGALLRAEEGAESPHTHFFYHRTHSLWAVRDRKWKLHLRRGDDRVAELYDLENDVNERHNVHDDHPDVVARLTQALDAMRRELGDEKEGIEGAACRPIGRVSDARPLCTFDPTYPYIIAEYDLPDRG